MKLDMQSVLAQRTGQSIAGLGILIVWMQSKDVPPVLLIWFCWIGLAYVIFEKLLAMVKAWKGVED